MMGHIVAAGLRRVGVPRYGSHHRMASAVAGNVLNLLLQPEQQPKTNQAVQQKQQQPYHQRQLGGGHPALPCTAMALAAMVARPGGGWAGGGWRCHVASPR